MRLPAFAVVALASLSACSSETSEPVAPSTPAAPPVMLAGVDLNRPVRAIGTEPFWAVELTGDEIVYSGVDRREQRAPKPAARVQGTIAMFDATTTAGRSLNVTLTATACSDGMSDREYPLSAIVKIGDETLTGCAASTAELDAATLSPVAETAQPAA